MTKGSACRNVALDNHSPSTTLAPRRPPQSGFACLRQVGPAGSNQFAPQPQYCSTSPPATGPQRIPFGAPAPLWIKRWALDPVLYKLQTPYSRHAADSTARPAGKCRFATLEAVNRLKDVNPAIRFTTPHLQQHVLIDCCLKRPHRIAPCRSYIREQGYQYDVRFAKFPR